MQIPRSYVENYNEALNVVSERACAELEAALRKVDYTAGVAEIREAVAAIMQRYCGVSTTLAARIAADFYDGLRKMSEVDGDYVSEIESMWNPEATRGGVKAIIETLHKDPNNIETFISQCVRRADMETRKAANQCIQYNAIHDKQKPRYARVPLGFETCDFCIMLASRGFVYKRAELASHAHAHCDCRVVPSWDKNNPSVQGYDPEYYYRLFKRLENATVIHEELYDMPPSEITARRNDINEAIRKAWKSYKDGGETAEAYRSSVGVLVRDASRSGRLSIEDKVDIKEKGHEVHLASWFADAGHDVVIRNPRGSKDTNDSVIDGETWEFKRLTTKSTKKFNRRMTEKIPRQGPSFIVDLSEGGLDKRTAQRLIVDLLEDDNIEKIILVKDGSAKLFEK